MEYNYEEIKDEVSRIVREACYAPENEFTNTVWDYHIVPVVEHANKLAKKLKADQEVVEMAAYLHDLSALLDIRQYENHHVHSADLAEKILGDLGFPKSKIKKVKSAIKSHRGSRKIKPKCKEARIVASADAMAHISEPVDIFYLTFGVHKYKTREGAEWMKGKINRSWKKIMPIGKKMVRAKYNLVIKLLDEVINK